MKKLLKIFMYLVTIIIALVIILLVTAKLAENRITDIALKKVSESIEAPVVIDNVSFNLLRKFPLATIELNDVFLGFPHQKQDSGVMSTNIDTIINIEKIYVSVKSRPLLSGIIEIMKVDVDGAYINYMVDSTGATNIDFLMDTTETTEVDTTVSDPLNMTLTKLSVRNIVCNFNDNSLKTKAKVTIPGLEVKAKLEGENVFAAAEGKMKLTGLGFEETNLHLMNKTEFDFNVEYENDSVSIKQLEINTDGAELSLLGSLVLGDKIVTDLVFEGTNLILEDLIKYAPKEMLTEYGVNQVSGNMKLDATVKGMYTDTEMPHLNVNLNFKNGNVATKDYPGLKNISFNGHITNGILRNNQSTQADFSSFHFETDQSMFDFQFSILDIDHLKYNVKSNMEINVSEFRDFMPDSVVQDIDGNIKASISTKGELPDSIGDDFVDYVMANSSAYVELIDFNIDVDSTLSIKNFSSSFAYNPNNIKVSNLNISVPNYNVNLKNTSFDADFRGSINNIPEMILDLKSYHIETSKSEFKGFGRVQNFDHPSYTFTSNIKLNLDEVFTMLPDSIVNTLSGNVSANIKSSGTINLDSITDQAMDIVFNSSEFKINFDNVSVESPDFPEYKLDKFYGEVEMKPEVISIKKMSGIAAEVSFEVDSTSIENIYETFIVENLDKEIIVQTNLSFGKIDYGYIEKIMLPPDSISGDTLISNAEIVENVETEDSDSAQTMPLLPNFKELGIPHFLIRGKLEVAQLIYEKNIIDDISVKFRFADSLYVIDQFKLKTCGGEINTSAMMNARGRFWEKPTVDLKNSISKLDINQLLVNNDNFDQTDFTAEKLAGILTSEFHARVFLTDGFVPPTNKIRAKGHFVLEEGRIYDYEPLVDMANSTSSIIAGGLKELDELDFNTLTTSFFMLNDKIYIPKTDVVTSSMDFTAFAMHSMQDDYEYHLELHLGDVFTGKSEKLMAEQNKQNKKDGGTIERKGLKLYTLKNGDAKNRGFDKDKLEEKFKLKLDKQQGWLNLFFNPMSVNFSTDLDRTSRNKELLEKYGKKSDSN